MLINKEAVQILSQDFMNNIHYEEIDIINEIYENIILSENEKDKENHILTLLEKWLEHTKEHFAIEEEHMRAYNFFAYECHKSEHDKAIEELKQHLNEFKDKRNIQDIKVYFDTVVSDWLANHISTMDLVTANFLSQFK
jgi:hemerythrin